MTPTAAADLMPDDVIAWGYNMFLAEWCDKPLLRQSAQQVAEVYNRFTEQFEEGTKEWWYCSRVRGAANSLARGIARRKRTHAERVAAAEQEKADMIARLSESERGWGLLKGGLRLAVLGGFSFSSVCRGPCTSTTPTGTVNCGESRTCCSYRGSSAASTTCGRARRSPWRRTRSTTKRRPANTGKRTSSRTPAMGPSRRAAVGCITFEILLGTRSERVAGKRGHRTGTR